MYGWSGFLMDSIRRETFHGRDWAEGAEEIKEWQVFAGGGRGKVWVRMMIEDVEFGLGRMGMCFREVVAWDGFLKRIKS